MHRYIILLFITGTVWSQTDFDELVILDGKIIGKFLKIKKEKDYFSKHKYESEKTCQYYNTSLKNSTFIINLVANT